MTCPDQESMKMADDATLYECVPEYWEGKLSKRFRCIIGYALVVVSF